MTLFQERGFQKIKGYITPYFSQFLRNYFTLIAQNGKRLIPQYTYARIYKKGSDLKIHSDRPECQYSVTLSLGGDSGYVGKNEKLWPIWIKDYDGKSHEVFLDDGDMVVYHGTELEHWREKFEGNTQYQLFMHYVDADGEFKDRIFDGRSNIGLKK